MPTLPTSPTGTPVLPPKLVAWIVPLGTLIVICDDPEIVPATYLGFVHRVAKAVLLLGLVSPGLRWLKP